MLIDYHVHTRASPDAEGSMREYVERAREKGIGEIGFSDHIILKRLDNRSDFLVHHMPAYVQDFSNLKETSQIPVRLGAEVDYFHDEVERIKQFIQDYSFDYVIGSVHVIGEWIIDEPSTRNEFHRRDIPEVYENYFRLVREMCECRLFDVLGHPDLVKIFGFRPKKDLTQLYDETAEAVARANMCAEVNSKGLIRPCRETYPGAEFLRILHDHNVPITLGSDAHTPSDLGLNLDEAMRQAEKVGYSEVCTFSGREKTLVRIRS